jgi:hypothetical protein
MSAFPKPHLNILISLNDPIGEVEDLYDVYEFVYQRHYAMNKSLIDDIRAKNQYPYAVADMLGYLYIDDTKSKRHEADKRKLQDLYETLVDLTQTQMSGAIEENMAGANIIPAMDYKIANDYYNELTFLFKEFFVGHYAFGLKLSSGNHIFTDNRHMQGKRLFASSKKHPELQNSPQKALAFLVFSVAFSPRYKEQRTAELKSAAEEFYYLVKNTQPLPQMNKKSLDEIKDELQYQNALLKIFSGKEPLLEEFEALDITLKQIAFDPKRAKKILKAKKDYGFESLKAGNATQEIYYDKFLTTPEAIAKKLSKALASQELTLVLKQYQEIKSFESEDEEIEYFDNMLNLLYMLSAPRAKLDEETQELSVFNNKNKAIVKMLTSITNRLNKIGEEKAQRVHAQPIKEYYLKALYTLIAHAALEKPNHNLPQRREKGALEKLFDTPANDKGRAKNATAFLEQFKQTAPQQKIQTDKLLDNNFDKDLKIKTKMEELYATLQQLDGVTSYLDKADGTVKGSVLSANDLSDDNKLLNLTNTTSYKNLLSSIKALSFFMTVGRIAEYTQGKEKLKMKNIVGVAQDTFDTTYYIADLLKVSKEGRFPPEKLESLVGLRLLVSESSFKIMARFGIVGAIVNAISDANGVDKDTNADYSDAIDTKNALYIMLMFAPAWWALGGIALVELVWFFLKDKIENSKIELYLYESLLFNTTQHNDNRTFNTQEGKAFKASIFLETLKLFNSQYDIANFTTMSTLREFIAQVHDEEPRAIEAAMGNELSRFKSVLYNIDITINKDKEFKIASSNAYDIYHIYPYVNLPRKLGNSVKRFMLLINGTLVQNGREFEVDNDVANFNTLPTDNLQGVETLANSDVNILLQTDDDICLKYKLTYEYTNTPYSQMKASSNQEMIMLKNLKITKIQAILLNEQDNIMLGK